MIHIYLCDDNEILLRKYQEMLTSIAKKHSIEIAIRTFTSGEQMLFHVEAEPNESDIIYLDIIMKELTGIETAKKLKKLDCQAEIIFLTSSEEFVFDSFDVSPLHYLIKDAVGSNKFEEVFLRAVKISSEKINTMFFCETRYAKKQIPVNKISYFEVNGRLMNVHYEKNSFEFYSTIDKIELSMSKHSFVRCHRSFLINLNFVDEIGKNEITLINGDIIPLGATYLKDVKLAFSTYLSNSFIKDSSWKN